MNPGSRPSPAQHRASSEPSPTPSPVPVPTVTRQPGCSETWYPQREATDGSLAKRPRVRGWICPLKWPRGRRGKQSGCLAVKRKHHLLGAMKHPCWEDPRESANPGGFKQSLGTVSTAQLIRDAVFSCTGCAVHSSRATHSHSPRCEQSPLELCTDKTVQP